MKMISAGSIYHHEPERSDLVCMWSEGNGHGRVRTVNFEVSESAAWVHRVPRGRRVQILRRTFTGPTDWSQTLHV